MESGMAMCIPLTCRGLQVLGFPLKDKIYLCVHQLAIELWKAYDTPRVSVQRKIVDLGIKIISSDRNMIRILRAAGIIDNFRATMILLRDAEILCDALELSRKKRGLVKHALQTRHKPGERSTRLEELRAKKFTAKMNSLYNLATLQSQSVNSVALTNSTKEPQAVIHSKHTEDPVRRWAPSGNRPSPPSGFESSVCECEDKDWAFDTLSVAQDPVILGGESCLGVELKFNSILIDMHRGKTRRLSSKLSGTVAVAGPTQAHHPKVSTTPQHLKPPSQVHSLTDQWEADEGYKPLSSPNTETSELEELHSTPSISSRSRQQSGSDTPERFLFLQESSESDFEEEELKPSSDRISQSRTKERCIAANKTQALSRRVITTKLRHFAQTTSPRTNVNDPAPPVSPHPSTLSHTNTDPPVPVKRKRGRPPKVKPRPTALSSFATKKRAMSHTPSPVISGDDQQLTSKQLNREGVKSDQPLLSQTDDTNISVPSDMASCQEAPTEVEMSDQTPVGMDSNPDAGSPVPGSVVEDDLISVASVSTNSTNSSGQRSATRVTRRTKTSDKERPPSFRFDELFNFYPPRLVVKDGELVPEHSLSVKKLDRNSIVNLPESHPFLNWSLGCPVPGKSSDSQGRNGRKRKALS